MERLGHIIQQAIELGTWKLINLSRNGYHLSHIFFANNLILFVEATKYHIRNIMGCLQQFCNGSAQRVIFQNSSIFFSKNVETTVAEEISNILSIPVTANLGRYLILPSIHGRMQPEFIRICWIESVLGWKDGKPSTSRTQEGWKFPSTSVLTTISFSSKGPLQQDQ